MRAESGKRGEGGEHAGMVRGMLKEWQERERRKGSNGG